MIRLALVLWLVGASLSFGAPVTVKSGEHEGFTPLVLDFGAPVNWTVGRTFEGYELRLKGVAAHYDLTQAFALIGKGRLAAIWADPATGSLHLGIACACHAIPFEFRPGIVVIDLRDGAPPEGSSFELTLAGEKSTALFEKPRPRPKARPTDATLSYIWSELVVAELQHKSGQEPQKAFQVAPLTDFTFEPLRESLLRQLSRGAAQGVVDMAMPKQPLLISDDVAQIASVRIGLGELTGVSSETGQADHVGLGAKGETCADGASLEFGSWGSDEPVSKQMADATMGLIGEFDKPDPVVLERAVKFQLFLGFGAEARQLLRAFPTEAAQAGMWQSLAAILDDDPDPAPFFHGQSACDTPAALWSVLSDPAPTKGDSINRNAVVLAFSALPVALRRHLGPRLVDRFLELADTETASTLRNAILRAPGDQGPDIAILEATIDLANGDAAEAEIKIDQMLKDPGPGTSAALVALVTARAAQNLPVEPALVVALEALMTEQTGSAAAPELLQALILAHAASGDFDAAFAVLPQFPQVEPDVWRLLANIGVDDAVLAHAVLSPDQGRPKAAADTAAQLAERLLGFGLAGPAQLWLVANNNPELWVRVRLAEHDGRGALSDLADTNAADTLALRAEAMAMVGDQAAAQAYGQAGDVLGQRQVLARARNWTELAKMDAEGWSPAIAALAYPNADPSLGPLARGHQLAQQSADTRAAVTGLLSMLVDPLKPVPQ